MLFGLSLGPEVIISLWVPHRLRSVVPAHLGFCAIGHLDPGLRPRSDRRGERDRDRLLTHIPSFHRDRGLQREDVQADRIELQSA